MQPAAYDSHLVANVSLVRIETDVNFSGTAVLLWWIGLILSVILELLLLSTKQRVLLSFRLWIGFGILASIGLLSLYKVGEATAYCLLYWASALADLALQLAILAQLAREASVRAGHWEPSFRPKLFRICIFSLVLASLSLCARPTDCSLSDELYARFSLFTTVLFCSLFSSLMRLCSISGMSWSTRSALLVYGLSAWNLGSFFTDTLHFYWRTATSFSSVEYIRSGLFIAVLLYWIALYCFPEKMTRRKSLNEAFEEAEFGSALKRRGIDVWKAEV